MLTVITLMLFAPSVLASLHLDNGKCWKMDTLVCLEIADQAWRNEKLQVALAYSKRGCDLGDSYTCGFHGYLLWETNNPIEALKYFKLACEEQVDRYCDLFDFLNSRVASSVN